MRPSFRSIASAAAFAALAACATGGPPPMMYKSQDYQLAQKQQEAGADPAKIMICEQETVTGSHIPTRHCWTKLEMDVARERAVRAAQEQQRLDPAGH
jgi:predicted small lipoprotein YifL